MSKRVNIQHLLVSSSTGATLLSATSGPALLVLIGPYLETHELGYDDVVYLIISNHAGSSPLESLSGAALYELLLDEGYASDPSVMEDDEWDDDDEYYQRTW